MKVNKIYDSGNIVIYTAPFTEKVRGFVIPEGDRIRLCLNSALNIADMEAVALSKIAEQGYQVPKDELHRAIYTV